MRVAIYSRVSKESSDNTNQLIVLRDYCRKMEYDIYKEFVDVISGGASNKPAFSNMMKDASQRSFDILLFFSLDRLTREGVRQTIHYLQMLESYGIQYKSYSEQYLDSTGIFADAIVALLATLARQERIRISERVHAGLAKARQNGRIGGRPSLNDDKIAKIKHLKFTGMSIMAISKELQVSRGTVYQYL
jgi:DNA invertase Pin-like site-specific DNA recombinase